MVGVSALLVFSPWASCLLINFIHNVKGFYFFSFQVLTFKEITWQTLRIEADATDSGGQDTVSTPLRLITNQGRIQIALKRRVSVLSVLVKMSIFRSPRQHWSWCFLLFVCYWPLKRHLKGEDLQFSVALKLLLREHVYFHHFNFGNSNFYLYMGTQAVDYYCFLLIRENFCSLVRN